MLFNSYIFVLVFLPLCITGYFSLNHLGKDRMARIFLLAMSLWFYGYFNVRYLAVILVSMGVNYTAVTLLKTPRQLRGRRLILAAAITFDIGLLFYFKYYGFFAENLNTFLGSSLTVKNLVLPLGISFFTFQQLSFVIDAYTRKMPDYGWLEYGLFVTYFPQLIAGPIVTHDQLIHQFMDKNRQKADWGNLAGGLYLFSLGMAKKVLIADTFGNAANWGFGNIDAIFRILPCDRSVWILRGWLRVWRDCMNWKVSDKTWTLICIGALSFGLGMVSLVTIIVDPFFHYHGPIKSLQYPINNERYQNDGIVRHFPYDAIVTGTSMTENFKTTEVDEIFQVRSVKVPFSGGPYKEINDNLERAVKANSHLRCVIRSLDYSMLLHDKDEMRTDTDYPDYLYDDIWWNDAAYVLNKEIFINNSLGVIRFTRNGGKTTTFDDYARWNDLYEFGKQAVDKTYSRPDRNGKTETFTDEDRAMIKENLSQNVIFLAKENPQITFYLFFTPYSIYYWDSLERQGNLIRHLEAEQYAIELLLECDNIKLFSFSDAFDMICNLDYYKDIAHYGEEINSRMLRWMGSGKHLLTRDNYGEYCKKVREFYTSYEYDRLWPKE